MLFLALKDAQAAQFQKDSDAIVRQRARTAANPQLNPPGNLAVAQAVNAVLVTITPDADPDEVASDIRPALLLSTACGRGFGTALRIIRSLNVASHIVGGLICPNTRAD